MTENTEQQPIPEPTPKFPELPAALLQGAQSVTVQADKLEEITDYLVASRSPQVYDTRIPFVVVPEGLKLLDVEKHMPVPSRIRKNITFTEVGSFLDYFKLFKDAYKPQIFATLDAIGIKFLSVFDFDGPGIALEDGRITAPQPQWNTHVARLNLSYHRDYQALINNAEKWHEQEDFALFIEENSHLFTNPDGATMLELAQDLKGFRNVDWKTGKRLANGKVTLEFVEEIEARTTKGDVLVPETLHLTSPIFEGFPPQEIVAAFRYRLDGNGGIKFSYRLLTKLAERKAQDEVKERIINETSLPVYAVSGFDGIVRS